MAPARAANKPVGMAIAPIFRKSQQLTSSFSFRRAVSFFRHQKFSFGKKPFDFLRVGACFCGLSLSLNLSASNAAEIAAAFRFFGTPLYRIRTEKPDLDYAPALAVLTNTGVGSAR